VLPAVPEVGAIVGATVFTGGEAVNVTKPLPVLELVFLATFFPPFKNQKSSVSSVAEWIFLQNLSENIDIDLYTICKRTSDNIDIHLIDESKKIMEHIFLEVISLNISKNQQKLQQD
jgi:hypothetical protein